jgi:hypothetical protein
LNVAVGAAALELTRTIAVAATVASTATGATKRHFFTEPS